MTDNLHTTEANNAEVSLTQIPQNQIISYLRHYFEVNNPNRTEIETNFNNILNHNLHHHNRNLNANNRLFNHNHNEEDDDEDKDENEDLEDYVQYHHLERQYTGEEDDDDLVDNQSLGSNNLSDSSQCDYIDFRVYPLNIDWCKVNNSDTHYFDFLQHYGYFGVATLTAISNAENIELDVDDFIYLLLSYYYDLVIQRKDNDNDNNNDTYVNESLDCFVKLLPSLNSIHCILHKGMVCKKEFLCVKIVIDIHDHYLRNFNKGLNRFTINDLLMPTICLFYSILSEEEIEHLYQEITNQMKTTHNILSKMGSKVFKQKSSYIKYYTEQRNNSLQLLGGLSKEAFLL